MSKGTSFKAAVRSFKAATEGPLAPEDQSRWPKLRGGRPPKNAKLQKIVAAMVEGNEAFFRKILDDDTERQLWMAFITGRTPVLGPDSKPVILDGVLQMQDLELNPISLKAFMKAVEYKRGTPTVAARDEGTGRSIELKVITMGAGEGFFEQRAKAAGLL